VIRNIEVIGEAGRNILKQFPEFAALHPELRLDAAYQMRNAVAHGYFKVDLEIVWATLENDLPELGRHIAALIAAFEDKRDELSLTTLCPCFGAQFHGSVESRRAKHAFA
jgi:uncharacterized protein with HEPN domain